MLGTSRSMSTGMGKLRLAAALGDVVAKRQGYGVRHYHI